MVAKFQVKAGTVVSAALLTAGIPCRRSATGQLRTALCGMGICFECRATVNGCRTAAPANCFATPAWWWKLKRTR